jgi:hypothetical protein
LSVDCSSVEGIRLLFLAMLAKDCDSVHGWGQVVISGHVG